MSAEALAPLAAAVDAALLGDAPLIAHLGGEHVFSLVQSEDMELDDYVVIASKESGAPFRRFNNMKGERLFVTLRAFSRVNRSDGSRIEGDGRVLATLGHLSRILVGNPLTVEGYGTVAVGEVFVQGVALTPTGERVLGIMRYEATCRQTPPTE